MLKFNDIGIHLANLGKIRPGLEGSSVILRLPASSEEAGYLEALFPVPKKPTVVVIQYVINSFDLKP